MNEPHGLDVVVIGAGVIGLAIARELALAGREVILLERHERMGEETSSRNSEVIHAGIYYPTDSLKAELCVRGKTLLYAYCEEKGIPYRRCGKIIVAVNQAQCARLDGVREQAIKNGVNDLESLTAAEVAEMEPAVHCAAGLLSPSTGIIDSHAFMVALQGDLEAAGGSLAVLSEFIEGSVENDGFRLTVRSGEENIDIKARSVINAAGLSASSVARRIAGQNPQHIPETRYAKGTYFVYQGKHPFQRLVYPLPEPGGLGVHVTLDLSGQARFGPDVEWIDEPDYSIDAAQSEAFFEAIQAYWPAVSRDALAPGYVGVRPKLVGPNEPAGDFVIHGPRVHGNAGLVNLFGIESPGLTAALAIGERVARLLVTTAD